MNNSLVVYFLEALRKLNLCYANTSYDPYVSRKMYTTKPDTYIDITGYTLVFEYYLPKLVSIHWICLHNMPFNSGHRACV